MTARTEPVWTGSEPDGALLEIACDESGAEGEHLVGGETDVFTHAGIALDHEAAENCMRETRRRIRSPATEYKANHLLREKHRLVLEWLLGPDGPIHGHARVQLIDKEFFVIRTLVDVLFGKEARARDTGTRDTGARHTGARHAGEEESAETPARTLHREGRSRYGLAQWQAFLESANELVRARNRWGPADPVGSFFDVVESLRSAGIPGRLGSIVLAMERSRSRAVSWREHLSGDSATPWTLDPVIAGLAGTIASWSTLGRPFAIVHDEQSALTTGRIAWLRTIPARRYPRFGRVNGDADEWNLVRLRRVDSQSDSRIQIADFLAGVARKIASDELNGRGDPVLSALLRPYVDPHSIWADDRSWSALAPSPNLR